LKDAVCDRKSGKNRYVAVGSGEIDYEGQFKALVNDRYDGCVSIETHYLIQGDGEKSTRETYQGLQNILNRIGYP
jgi:sugar phosphate isomerase/epimerase